VLSIMHRSKAPVYKTRSCFTISVVKFEKQSLHMDVKASICCNSSWWCRHAPLLWKATQRFSWSCMQSSTNFV